jgi:hypothetical protein
VNVPKHGDGISLREMAALADALKQLAADIELKSEVVFCPGLEPFVEFDLRGERTRQATNDDGRAPWEGGEVEVEQWEETERTTLG